MYHHDTKEERHLHTSEAAPLRSKEREERKEYKRKEKHFQSSK